MSDEYDTPTFRPTPGRTVEYKLSDDDARRIRTRRKDNGHVGNPVQAGQTYPMVITRCWGTTPGSAVNGQVHLDGTDVLWVTSVTEGHDEGRFRQYPRV